MFVKNQNIPINLELDFFRHSEEFLPGQGIHASQAFPVRPIEHCQKSAAYLFSFHQPDQGRVSQVSVHFNRGLQPFYSLC